MAQGWVSKEECKSTWRPEANFEYVRRPPVRVKKGSSSKLALPAMRPKPTPRIIMKMSTGRDRSGKERLNMMARRQQMDGEISVDLQL